MPQKKTLTLPQAGSQADSDSNLSSTAMTDTDTQESTNPGIISKPRLRKRQHEEEWSVFMADIKKMFYDFKIQQEESFKAFQKTLLVTIEDIKKQNGEIRSSIEFLSKKYDEINTKINKIEKEKKEHNLNIGQLEENIEVLEKKSKQSCLEIRNIPTKKSENKSQLLDLIQKLSLTLKVPVESYEIRDVYRTNAKPEANKPICLEFTSVVLKEKFLQAFKSYNKEHRGIDRLSTKNLQLDFPSQPIYISEALTFKCKRLFYQAREFAKANNYRFCWTSHGKVYLRKQEGAPFNYIQSEYSLTTLEGGKAK